MILLEDEPSNNVDAEVRFRALSKKRALIFFAGCAIMVVSHDP